MPTSFPFDAVNGQPAYNADDFRAFFRALIPENGVIQSPANPDSLLVSRVNNTSVRVAPGAAFIHGAGYLQDETLTLTVAQPCLIVCRFDLDAREIRVQAVPEYIRTDSRWDIVLAEFRNNVVTDLRGVRQNWATALWPPGLFPLAQQFGGTGADNAAQARQNLGLAAAGHTHTAAQITSGTLPVARGGLSTVSGDGVLRRNGYVYSIIAAPQAFAVLWRNNSGNYAYLQPPALNASTLIEETRRGNLSWASPRLDPWANQSFMLPGVYHLDPQNEVNFQSWPIVSNETIRPIILVVTHLTGTDGEHVLYEAYGRSGQAGDIGLKFVWYSTRDDTSERAIGSGWVRLGS